MQCDGLEERAEAAGKPGERKDGNHTHSEHEFERLLIRGR